MNTPARHVLYTFLILFLTPIFSYSETTHCAISETLTWNDDLTSKAAVTIPGLSVRATLKSALPWTGTNPRENLTLPTWGAAFAPVPEIMILCGAITKTGTPARLTNLPVAGLASTIPAATSISGVSHGPVLSPGNSSDSEYVGIDFSGKSWKAVSFASPTKFGELPSWLQLTKTAPPENASIFRYSLTAFSGIAHPETGKDRSWLLGERGTTAAPILLPGVECIAGIGPVSAGCLLSANIGALAKPTGAIKADITVKKRGIAITGDLFLSGNDYMEFDGDKPAVTERFSVSAAATFPPIGSGKIIIGAKVNAAMERPAAESLSIKPGIMVSGGSTLSIENRTIHSETQMSADPKKTAVTEKVTLQGCVLTDITIMLSGKATISGKKESPPEVRNMESGIGIRIAEIGPCSVTAEMSAKKTSLERPLIMGAKAKVLFRAAAAASNWDFLFSADKSAVLNADFQNGKSTFPDGLIIAAGLTARLR